MSPSPPFARSGAGHSTGRTSWTARPERDDLASVVSFVVHYVDRLGALAPDDGGDDAPVLLMCGYSYGALVTAQLDPLDAVVARLAAPAAGSAAAEIRRRAEHLAASPPPHSPDRALAPGPAPPPPPTPRPAYLLVSPLQGLASRLVALSPPTPEPASTKAAPGPSLYSGPSTRPGPRGIRVG